MKKVLVFLLILAIALGGIGFAHAAVTASQDDLLVYPTLEIGDPTILDGLTASMTFACGDHLRWHTDYPFGGKAVTEFSYSRKPISIPTPYMESSLDVWFISGMSTSVSGGSLSLNASDYSSLFQAVAKETPRNGSKTMELDMADYVDYYLPDYQLRYEDDTRQCSESASFYDFANRDYQNGIPLSYRNLMEAFRFPVQEGHIVSVTLDKDDADRVVGLQFYSEQSPDLHFLSDVTAEGVWFVPMFLDENGAPLPYESPSGHGIYFIPWKNDGIIRYASGDKERVMLDVKNARLRFPLDESLRIDHMIIDAESHTAQMLTVEDGTYILTTCDLENGTVRSRLEILPQAPDALDTTATFRREGDYLLLLIQDQLALTDAAGEILYLTAPEPEAQTFGARFFDPDTGDLRFDGKTLILTDTTWYQEGTFWAAAWRQDALLYYGEYDCSINRGNDNWYYSPVTAEKYPIILK